MTRPLWWRRLRYALLLLGLCAVATCPTAKRACTSKARTREAEQMLGYLADRVEAHAAATGRVPPAAAGPTPEAGCCTHDRSTCAPDAAQWSAPGWRALAFSIDGEHRFSYQYLPDPSGLGATLRARGDLSCDETPTVVELTLTIAGGKLSRAWAVPAPTAPAAEPAEPAAPITQ